ncbi:hypothetical protein HDV00_007594 [Rhizophlyctis rosea]|nr:hypothetical protein HDV00_007594 [Rhizophlyctis rosea]
MLLSSFSVPVGTGTKLLTQAVPPVALVACGSQLHVVDAPAVHEQYVLPGGRVAVVSGVVVVVVGKKKQSATATGQLVG